MKKGIVAVLLSTLWISLSEFLRNEFLFKHTWTDHYISLGLIFPSEPINGMIWGVWSLCFAIGLYIISRRFSLSQTASIGWFMGFVLMWLVTANMLVLPTKLLLYAVPLSILEAFVASWIIVKLAPTGSRRSI